MLIEKSFHLKLQIMHNLDVYLFRQYLYAKRITDFIKLRSSNMQPKLHDRFFIMKMHSVTYNQLSAEAYRPMLHYA